ncbi:MAG TPA: hypothetical protein VG308_10890 [Stellaceae bacterium]|nr:hypothetical protein [Stellaceae bacterium]
MKLYLIAAGLFALAFLALGILTASVMSGPEKPQGPQAGGRMPGAAASPPRGAATVSHGAPTYEPAAPSFAPASSDSARSGAETGRSQNGLQLPGTLPAANAPISLPPSRPSQSGPNVPIIQPTDLGTSSSPTAGRMHQ